MKGKLTKDQIRTLAIDLEKENELSEAKIKLYHDSISKGFEGFWELICKEQDAIVRNNALILVLLKPELNPLLGERFDLSPKPLHLRNTRPV